jgi:hypothetical protein
VREVRAPQGQAEEAEPVSARGQPAGGPVPGQPAGGPVPGRPAWVLGQVLAERAAEPPALAASFRPALGPALEAALPGLPSWLLSAQPLRELERLRLCASIRESPSLRKLPRAQGGTPPEPSSSLHRLSAVVQPKPAPSRGVLEPRWSAFRLRKDSGLLLL